MRRLNREKKTDSGKEIRKRPLARAGKLLAEGLIGLATAGLIASCAASAAVSVRSGSATASASSQPAGFGMPALHESEIRLKKQGDTLEAEVHEISDIQCDAANRCTTESEPLKSVKLSFEVYDSGSRRYRQIDGCTEDKRTCDISKVPRGSRIRVRFVPPQDFERPVQGDTATTVRE